MANLFTKLGQSLKKTRDSVFAGLFSGRKLGDEFYEELEEAMLVADMGYETTQALLDSLKQRVKEQKLTDAEQARECLVDIIADYMKNDEPMACEKGGVILVVGVNGVGKTTTIGKLANWYKKSGKSPVLAAADTFRAAATEQLCIWADRAEVPIIKSHEGADPAAVVFDASHAFVSRGHDLLIVDTAGRLHNKTNLMNELQKIRRVLEKELPEQKVESLLVLDATTGQNAIMQAKAFAESAGVTGVVVTKLDGSAKGGMAVAIKQALGLPVRFVGLGEGIDDLEPFDPKEFAKALITS